MRYYADTVERSNCFMIPFGDTPLMCWATTADVEPGDEQIKLTFPNHLVI